MEIFLESIFGESYYIILGDGLVNVKPQTVTSNLSLSMHHPSVIPTDLEVGNGFGKKWEFRPPSSSPITLQPLQLKGFQNSW